MSFSARDISIVSVGAGNLATNLVKALHDVGFPVLQVYSHTEQSAAALAAAVCSGYTTDLSELINNADLYIVSLKDSAFTELLPQIVAGKGNAMFVHTAGSLPMSLWEGYAVRYGVLYPLQTFSKQRQVDWGEIPFFIEASGSEESLLLKYIAATLSEKIYEIDSEQRRSLHLAAVFACNFTNHLYTLASDVVKKYQLPFDVLLPLIDETARKVHELLPEQAQTGPAVRYDENVISKHLEMLADDPHKENIYKLLSESIYNRYRK